MSREMAAVRRYFQSLAGCAYLFAGGCLKKENRGLLYTICNHFGFEKRGRADAEARPEARVPSLSLRETIRPGETVQLTEINAVDGNVSLLELTAIGALVRQTRALLCLEIGTFDGRTTLNIASNRAPGGRVYTLDLPSGDRETAALALEREEIKYIEKPLSGARFHGREETCGIVQLFGDSARFDFSEFHGQVDFLFVDGSHSYEYAKADSLTALKLMRPGASIIVWHDYDTPTWYGVTQALNELYADHPAFSTLRRLEGTSLCFLRIP